MIAGTTPPGQQFALSPREWIFRFTGLLIAASLGAPVLAQTAPWEPAGSQPSEQPQPAISAEPERPFSLDVSLAVVSDYRFRGISLSDKHPAIQPSITLTHRSGFYASVWGSNIADNGGDDIEVDLVAGYAGEAGPISYGVNATYYAYPGTTGLGYVELFANVGAAVGPATLTATVGYVPRQSNVGDRDNLYVGISAIVPIAGTPLSLVGAIGIENGAFAAAKRDWSLGINADIGGFTLGLAYVDAARTGGNRLGEAGALVSISRAF
jgi:uncharacterized protein (TIGR02001 family)